MTQSIDQPKQKCSLGCSECPEASFTRQSHNPMFCVSSVARHQQVSHSDVLRLINGEAPTKITIIEYNEARAQCHSTVNCRPGTAAAPRRRSTHWLSPSRRFVAGLVLHVLPSRMGWAEWLIDWQQDGHGCRSGVASLRCRWQSGAYL